MKTVIPFLVAAALSQPVYAECSHSLFSKNGLFYSPTGDPEDAWRRGNLNLPKNKKYKDRNYTALEGTDRLRYSPEGKFFLRAGANQKDFILVLPRKNSEAVLVRSISHSVSRAQKDERASFVSVTRADLDFGACDVVGSEQQAGLREDKYFYETNEFVLAHSDPRQLSRTRLLDKRFHFVFQGADGCHHTGRLTDKSGKWASSSIYTGNDKIVVNPKGQFIIEQAVFDVAQIFLPQPAFASLPSLDNPKPDVARGLVVSSVEASLHNLPSVSGVCIELSAPIPTGEYSKRWFSGAKAHKRAAMRAAKKGEWKPKVTEFHFQQIENRRQSAFVRLHWLQ